MSSVLFVSATAEEAAYLPEGVRVLITGVGTMNTAVAMAAHLANPENPRPERIVNLGTAGALREGFTGIFEIHEVTQHDFSSALIEEMIGRPVPNERQLLPVTGLPAARLATGDAFINNSADRERLSASADLVDMEGYAVARIGAAFDIPVTLIKQVSDNADEQSTGTWFEAARDGAQELSDALRAQGWVG